jgi:hypothetical protein
MAEPTPEEFVDTAVKRYHNDAEFHAVVDRAAAILRETVKKAIGVNPPEQDDQAFRLGAAVALLLKETGG